MFINYRNQPVSKLTKSRPEDPRSLQRLGRSPVQRPTSSDKAETRNIASGAKGMTVPVNSDESPALLRLVKALSLRLILG